MDRLTETDLQYVVRRIPKRVRELLEHSPARLYVGGGFVRDTIAGLPVKDVDLLGDSTELLKAEASALSACYDADGGGKVIAHTTDNAITVLAPPRLPVQFITRWTFPDPVAALSSFDFTVCQAVVFFEYGTWHSRCAEAFYPDLAARRLVYTYPQREEEAGGSMMRVRKFLARGWNIQAASLGGVIARVTQKVQWDRINRFEGAAREKELAGVIAGLLREVDPLLIVNGLEPIEDPGEGA